MSARHEKIFNRDDGSRVRVVAEINMGGIGGIVYYTVWIEQGRDATPAEIQQTKMELWEQLKP